MGRQHQQEAADDREFERIMAMSDDEVIASVGGHDEAERIAADMRHMVDTAWIEASRRRAKISSSGTDC